MPPSGGIFIGSSDAVRALLPANKKATRRWLFAMSLAERAGFEPAVGINPHTLSRRAT
jgi:hypothetical protein